MKSLLRTIRRAPKLSGFIAVLVAVVTVPAALMAWGPVRPTFTVDSPASYVTFNSITDNPVVGDERNFVAVKDAANKQDGGWKDTITAQPGKEYMVRVYVHNNAAANLDLVAKNTRVMAALGTNTGKKVSLTGYVSADNAKPQKVYDDVHFESGDTFNLAYVPGSAMLYNNVTGQEGRAVSDNIVDGSGAQIGYEANNGKIPGCFQYATYVTFKVKPQFAEKVNFTTEKSVRKKGDSQWQNSLKAQAGDTVQYRVLFQNTSGVQLDNVMLDDKLPRDVAYVDGSTRLYLASDPDNARTMPDGITGDGLNIGSYGKNGLAAVIFDAKIAEKSELECGKNILKNVATATTDYGEKSDDATVTVQKDCEEPEPVMVEVCEIATGKIVTVTEEAAKDSDKYGPVDSDACKEQPEPIMVEVCEIATGKIVTVTEEQAQGDRYAPVGDEACQEQPEPVLVEVCEIATGNIITVSEDKADDAAYAPADAEACAPVVPETPEEPKEEPAEPTTEVPAELPQTGMAKVVSSVVGLGSLTAATYYYVTSRRA